MSNEATGTDRDLWVSTTVDIGISRLTQIHKGGDNIRPVGDCYRTAIACLLGLDDPAEVPHFVQQRIDTGDDRWEDVRLARHWLRDNHDLDLLMITAESAVGYGTCYLASVASKAGPWPHVVVCRAGEVIHDPSGIGGYTLEDLHDPAVELLVAPYRPDPDEMVRLWSVQSGSDEGKQG